MKTTLRILAILAIGGSLANAGEIPQPHSPSTIGANDATAQMGKLLSLGAWVNKFPGSTQSLNATGSIMAPSPCHIAAATKDTSGDSSIVSVKVTIEAPQAGVECMLLISPIPFRYQEKPYSGTHKRMKISSEKDSQTIDIATVH